MTGQVIEQGVQVFTPIINRLREIAQEFIPYFIYICIGTLGITLIWGAVKMIMGYLKRKTERTEKQEEAIKSMKARRTRRRRERRLKRYLNKYDNGYESEKVKFGQRGYNSRKN